MATPSLSLWRRRHDKEACDDEAEEKGDKEEEKEKEEQESDDKPETEDVGSHDKEDSDKKEVLRERMGQEELNRTEPLGPEILMTLLMEIAEGPQEPNQRLERALAVKHFFYVE